MKEPTKKSFFSYIPKYLEDLGNQDIRDEFTRIIEDYNDGIIFETEAIRMIKRELKKLETF